MLIDMLGSIIVKVDLCSFCSQVFGFLHLFHLGANSSFQASSGHCIVKLECQVVRSAKLAAPRKNLSNLSGIISAFLWDLSSVHIRFLYCTVRAISLQGCQYRDTSTGKGCSSCVVGLFVPVGVTCTATASATALGWSRICLLFPPFFVFVFLSPSFFLLSSSLVRLFVQLRIVWCSHNK